MDVFLLYHLFLHLIWPVWEGVFRCAGWRIDAHKVVMDVLHNVVFDSVYIGFDGLGVCSIGFTAICSHEVFVNMYTAHMIKTTFIVFIVVSLLRGDSSGYSVASASNQDCLLYHSGHVRCLVRHSVVLSASLGFNTLAILLQSYWVLFFLLRTEQVLIRPEVVTRIPLRDHGSLSVYILVFGQDKGYAADLQVVRQCDLCFSVDVTCFSDCICRSNPFMDAYLCAHRF